MITFKEFLLLEITSVEHFTQYITQIYPDLTLEQYEEISDIDPTKKQNKKGKYTEWILKILKNDANFHNETILKMWRLWKIREVHIKLKNLLLRYIKQSNKKDINSFISLSKFLLYIESLPKTEREVKQETKNIYKSNDIKIISENENWIIAKPLTYEGSKQLACYKSSKGADWCTARQTSTHGWDDYNQRGFLFVVINKSNSIEKYQIFFDLDKLKIDEIQDFDQTPMTISELIQKIGIKSIEPILKQAQILKQRYS